MRKTTKRWFGLLMSAVLLAGGMTVQQPEKVSAATGNFTSVGGYNETIYAQISGISDEDVTAVSYSGTMTGSLTGEDFQYLVRDYNGGVRIDIPGIKAGTYTLTVGTTEGTLTQSGIVVNAQDRSGFAHFNYTAGVGAYNDDGTLKDNAIVLYVTDGNKNTVTLSYGGVTVTGIGNILNSVGKECNEAGHEGQCKKTVNGNVVYAAANSNQGIIELLASNNIPLDIRFIGTVSESGLYQSGAFNANCDGMINGLTAYASNDYGGSEDDNGHMARIKSGKDITLEGIGTDAVIDGWGFHYMAESAYPLLGKSFEVKNLTFINTPEDAIGMEGVQASSNTSSDLSASVERCWIHNNAFYVPNILNPSESDKSEGDGSVDFKRGQYFTCSYNYFEGCHKTNLVGSSDSSLQYNLTYHHNYWKYCKARGPLARNANIHMYNNVFEGQTDYAMNTRANAYIFSEYNLFYMCKSPQAVESGAIKSYGDCFSSYLSNKGTMGTVVTDRSVYVPNNCQFAARGIDYSRFDTDSTQSYIPSGNYEIQENITQVKKVVYACAGVMKENPAAPENVSMSEISLLPAGTTPVVVTELPYSNTSIGKINKKVYAFTIGTTADVTVQYSSDVLTSTGVLVNEAGEAFLTGSGTAYSLPAGTYMIQPMNFQPGSSSGLGTFKEITINSLEISSAGPEDDSDDDSAELRAISLSQSSLSMTVNTTAQLSVTYTPSDTTTDKTVTWTSSDASVASVSANGTVTAIQAGTATITATVANNFTASCTVTVGNSTVLPSGDMVHNFTTDEKNSSFYTITGDNLTTKYTAVYNGTTLTKSFKMNSKADISFTAPSAGKLTLVFSTENSGKIIDVNGQKITLDATGIVEINLPAGAVKIVRSSGESNLFYMSFAAE